MQVQHRQLPQTLANQLPGLVVLSSAEPFLLEESVDLVRKTARDAGYIERRTFHAERSFNWSELLHEAQSLSLFEDKKLLEVHLPNAKPGDAGAKILTEYAALDSPDCMLLLIMGKLEAASLRSKWYKTLDSVAVICRIWPINANELPGWINNRMRQAGLKASDAAVRLLTEKVEGNLLAAAQEIEKLAMLGSAEQIDEEHIMRSIGNSARYNAFELVESALQGSAESALRMLSGLRAEGVDARSVLWALSNEIRGLHTAIGQGSRREASAWVQRQKMPRNRQQALLSYLTRASRRELNTLHQLATETDRRIKGAVRAEAWDSLAELVVVLSGRKASVIA